jgi:hypothetical protein
MMQKAGILISSILIFILINCAYGQPLNQPAAGNRKDSLAGRLFNVKNQIATMLSFPVPLYKQSKNGWII